MSFYPPAFTEGVRASLPVLLGVVPFGIITGVAMVASGIPPLVAVLMSLLVFAGASMVASAQLLASGSPALLVVLTTLIINLRFMAGSDALPDYVSGHIGYAVVPWKRRHGYATRALALLLPVAREVGLTRVELTCDDDNDASRRIILANGGVPAGSSTAASGKTKLVFTIDLTTYRHPGEGGTFA